MNATNEYRDHRPPLEVDGDDGTRDDAPAGTSLRELAADTVDTDTGAIPGHRVHVILEDGASFTVRIDNRDFVAFDRLRPKLKLPDAKEAPFLFQTFLAWHAGRREGLHALRVETFLETCLEAKDEKTDEDTAFPTR